MLPTSGKASQSHVTGNRFYKLYKLPGFFNRNEKDVLNLLFVALFEGSSAFWANEHSSAKALVFGA